MTGRANRASLKINIIIRLEGDGKGKRKEGDETVRVGVQKFSKLYNLR